MDISPIYKKFQSQKDCTSYLEIIFWDGKPQCPFCGFKKPYILAKENRYRCRSCKSPFSVTVLTLFHKSKLDLQKWFYAVANEHLSCRKLADKIEVTKDTAHFMLQRISIARMERPEIINRIKKEIYEQYH